MSDWSSALFSSDLAARKGGGRHPGRALEQTVEMMRRITDARCEIVERDRFLGGLDQRDRARDGDAIAADLVVLAAQAGAKTRRPRRRRIGIERDVLATRLARGAARLDIDAEYGEPSGRGGGWPD